MESSIGRDPIYGKEKEVEREENFDTKLHYFVEEKEYNENHFTQKNKLSQLILNARSLSSLLLPMKCVTCCWSEMSRS